MCHHACVVHANLLSVGTHTYGYACTLSAMFVSAEFIIKDIIIKDNRGDLSQFLSFALKCTYMDDFMQWAPC